jgi:nucleoside-diphosphate-sugar epimerase
VQVDAADPLQTRRAMEGMDFVINAVGGAPARLRAVTASVCRATAATGARMVHISSMAVYGGATGLVAETAPLFAETAYAAAKISCEAEMAGFVARGMEGVILRPGVVYGPGSVQWTQRIGRLLRAGRLGDLGAAGEGFCNLLHERDLAAAAIAACLRPEAAGGIFNLASPAPPTWNDYFVALARALGATPVRRIGKRRLAFEAGVLAPALALGGRLAARLGADAVPDPISPRLLQLFGQRIRLDPSRADAVLGFARTQDAAGIAGLAAA